VAADDRRFDRMPLEQLECLGVLAGRDLDLVAVGAEQLDQRPKNQHMRWRRDVNPNVHLASLAGVGSRRAKPGSAAT
jgi:hypothetical protein